MDRILLIEDDAGSQLLFKNRLEELGYDVVVASTGARGLLEARAGKFDLFLVDIGLGSGIDGYEVCRRLKAMPQIHGMPVVLISGQVKSQDELHRGYQAGCEAFLVKGDLTLVEDVVRAMLRIKSLQDDLGLQNRLLEEQNRRLQEERQRGADLESALRETGSRADVFRELAAGRPDGVLLVDGEGVVRMSDRGAQNVLGKEIEGRHLAALVPGSGLEAFVRDARTEPHDAFRFDIGDRSTGRIRSLSASIMPTMPSAKASEPPFKVVLLLDESKRRVAAEMLRLEEHGIPRRELGPLLEAARQAYQPSAIIGRSDASQALRERLVEVAQETGPVLIQGEQGTRKELLARVIHYSGGASGPFIPVNCRGLAPALLESELFGHVKDAFSAAVFDRPGLIEQAQHGTVFLEAVDAIGEPIQVKLLEVLEESRVRRLGSNSAEPVDVRILTSTCNDLPDLVAHGVFKRDLWQRLRGIEVFAPPLRQRKADIEALAARWLERCAPARQLSFSAEAAWILTQYDWPQNLRELESTIEAACAATEGTEIQVSGLSQPLSDLYRRLVEEDTVDAPLPAHAKESPAVLLYQGDESDESPLSLELYERMAIRRALFETKGDKVAAARLLNIAKSTFYRKLKVHGLDA